MACPFLIDEPLVGGVGGGGGGAANLWWVGGRCGRGGGGGGMQGAVTVTLEGGGGAALVIIIEDVALDIGGDGGLAIGGLRTRFVGLDWGSFKQSCDWWRDGGVGARTGGDLGNLMLCALETLPELVKLNFLGGGDGFWGAVDGGGGLGASVGLPKPLWPSVLELAESAPLDTCTM